MKKIIVLLFLLFSPSAYALNLDKAIVQALYDFSSLNPRKDFAVRVVEEYEFDGVVLEPNAIVRGKIIETVGPKRAKRNAYFVFKPSTYTIPSKGGAVKNIWKTDIEARALDYVPFDKVKAAESAGLTIAGLFVTGVAQIYHFGKGFSKAKKGENRFAKGGKEVYENSPFVYIRKGEELHINKGDVMTLRFYHYEVPKWRFWSKY